jgi:hypothetical protein
MEVGGQMSYSSSKVLIVANLVALIATFIVNTYTGILGMNGYTTGEYQTSIRC